MQSFAKNLMLACGHVVIENVQSWHKYSLVQRLVFIPPIPLYSAGIINVTQTSTAKICQHGSDFALHVYNENRSWWRLKRLLCFFHGNAMNINQMVPELENLHKTLNEKHPEVDYHVVSLEYKGYDPVSYNFGRCDEHEIVQHCLQNVLDWKARLSITDNDHLSLMGFSIGTGVACQVALQQQCKNLILVAPFTSIREVASTLTFRWAKYCLAERFHNKEALQSTKQQNTIIVHGDKDQIIPFEHGVELADVVASQNKSVHFVGLKGQGHNNLDWSSLCNKVVELIR